MIAVLGATGFTGRLVARVLREKKVDFFIAGRNESALQFLSIELDGVPTRRIDVKDSKTYASLADCTVIINCAGPFTELGEPIVQEALSRKIHYIDSTGEQAFIKLVYDKYGQAAKSEGIALVPACAFEYAIGDAAGEISCREMAEGSQLEIIYMVDGMYTSPGTRKSIVHAMSSDGYFQYLDGRLSASKGGPAEKSLGKSGKRVQAVPFPAGEVLMLSRHVPIKGVKTYLAMNAPRPVLSLFGTFGKPLVKTFAPLLLNFASGGGTPTDEQRKETSFTISARAENEGKSRTVAVSGKDPYFLTAVILADIAIHLKNNGNSVSGGITPSMVAGADRIREITSAEGVVWDIS